MSEPLLISPTIRTRHGVSGGSVETLEPAARQRSGCAIKSDEPAKPVRWQSAARARESAGETAEPPSRQRDLLLAVLVFPVLVMVLALQGDWGPAAIIGATWLMTWWRGDMGGVRFRHLFEIVAVAALVGAG